MNIKVNITGKPYTGKTVTFTAPCDCASVTDGLSINGEIYTVCDAMGNCVTGKGGAWASGAQISVVLDCENKKAFIQSTGTGAYRESRITATLLAANWTGNTYSFETEYPHASHNISIEVAPTATAEQFEAFGAAMICGSVDSNVATAIGDVPTVDIPILVKVVKK